MSRTEVLLLKVEVDDDHRMGDVITVGGINRPFEIMRMGEDNEWEQVSGNGLIEIREIYRAHFQRDSS